MSGGQDPSLPEDLRDVEDRLRRNRLDAGPAELDRVKRRALAQFRAGGLRTGSLRTRLAAVVTGAALLAGAGGAVALSGLDSHPNASGGAADKQYKPPKGCHKHPKQKKCGRPPKAQTGPAQHVGKRSATLTGRVVVYNHVRTRYYFVWGVCPHMNHRAGAGSTSSTKNVSVTITGLNPGTKYCYKLVATNSRGTSRGATRSFKTHSAQKSGGHGTGHGHGNGHGNGHKGNRGHKGHKTHHGPRQPSHRPRKSKGFTG